MSRAVSHGTWDLLAALFFLEVHFSLNRSLPGTRALFCYLVNLGSGPYREDNTSSWPTEFYIVSLLSDDLPADRIA